LSASLLSERDVVVTCPPVIQEVLQGAPDRTYDLLYERLLQLKIVEDPMPLGVFELAADYYRAARAAGYTIKSPNDCLIAACAVNSNLPLLHRDGDFDILTRVTPLRAINLNRVSAA
jgi:predicted nucleic acid-binding protein